MRIVMGADHAGYQLKERLKENLIELGHEVVDKGQIPSNRLTIPTMQLKFALILRRMVALAYSSVELVLV